MLYQSRPGATQSQTKVLKDWANDQQHWLYLRGPMPTLLVGGQNSGKTSGCVLKGLTLLQTYPGSRLAVVRRSSIQLQKTTMETWFQWCSPGFYRPHGSFNQNTGVLDLNNGSRVYFLHLDQPDSLGVLAGLELNFAYVSQVEEIALGAWKLLEDRIGRWTGATVPEEILNSYPGGRDAWPWRAEEDPDVVVPPRYLFCEGYVTDETHWLFERFADADGERCIQEHPKRPEWRAKGYECKIVDSDQNKYAIKAVTEALLNKDDEHIRRLVRPHWGNPEGTLFTISPLSLLQPTPELLNRIRLHMRIYRCLDHGDTAPVCVGWYGVDADGRVFFFREYYRGNLLVIQHRKNLLELSVNDPPYAAQFADSAIFDKSRGRTATSAPEWSVADEWMDQNIGDPRTAIVWAPATSGKDEFASRARVKAFLHVDERVRHPITNELGAPRAYFVVATPDYPNGCVEILKDIRAQKRKEIEIAGDIKVFSDERDPKVRDHGYDMCVSPETRILRGTDLRWVAAGAVRVGDTLLGFDREGTQRRPRRWRPAVVEAVKTFPAPSYELVLSDGGSVVCAFNHEWLTQKCGGRRSSPQWRTVESLLRPERGWKSGHRAVAHRCLLRAFDPWRDDASYGAGYLAGVLDGEGHVARNVLQFAQKDNALLSASLEALRERNIPFSLSRQRGGIHRVAVLGGQRQRLRTLGVLQPKRLLSRLDLNLGRLEIRDTPSIVAAIPRGLQPVVAIQTTTGTYFAEGLASSNCKYALSMQPAPADPPPPQTSPSGQISVAEYERAGAEQRRRRSREARRRGPGAKAGW